MSLLEGLRGLPHRGAAGRLLACGWNVCGIGDWATVWRSPDGTRVARVSPFEPAYGVFVRLCREFEGHPLLPRIDFDAPLAGGGRVTVMEFLLPVEPEEAEKVRERWRGAAPDDPITDLRREAERLDAEAAEVIPFWGGLDDNPGNVMKNAAGELKLVDLFYADGLEIFRLMLEDPAKIADAIPPERRGYICEIAAVSRLSDPKEMAALRAAAERIA